MATLSFLCTKCHREFDADVGEITFPRPQWWRWFSRGNGRPQFECSVVCPVCGPLAIGDEALLTEAGQSRLTELFLAEADRRDDGNTDLFRAYRRYREAGKRLHHAIMDQRLDKTTMDAAAKMLGIAQRGTYVFDSEDETAVLMDFALYESVTGGASIIKAYCAEAKEERGKEEQEVLALMAKAYTSLFRVRSIDKRVHALMIDDILRGTKPAPLIDANFSASAVPGMLMFFRLVPCNGFSMTSGAPFPFLPRDEEAFLAECRQRAARVKTSNQSIQRYVAFFQMHREYGIETEYADSE